MKTFLRLSALIFACFFPLAVSIFAQGSLTPPGAPAPTMKSLDQVRPGIPIDPGKAGFTTPYNISAAGSYYLAGNIAVASGNAIVISTNGVTLDLSGFTISSTSNPVAGSAVLVNDNLNNITILNGFIAGNVTNTGSGSGFSFGINANGSVPFANATNVRVAGISVSGCGSGIVLGSPSLVEACKVFTVGGTGISGDTIKGSTARNCGSTGISGNQVSDCQGNSSGSSSGITAFTVQNSQGSSVAGTGIFASSSAQNCFGSSSSSTGINSSGTVQNCYGFSGSGTGITAQAAENCRATSSSGTAFSVFTGGSLTGCSADGNGGAHGVVASDYCTITGCTITNSAVGIKAGKTSNVTNCVAQSSTGNGINVDIGSSVTGCTVSGSSGDGISGTSKCYLGRNTSTSNGGIGIRASADSCIEGNTSVSNNIGIQADLTGNVVFGNRARNTTNYSITTGNRVGTIVVPALSGTVLGNAGAAGFGSSDPWINIAY